MHYIVLYRVVSIFYQKIGVQYLYRLNMYLYSTFLVEVKQHVARLIAWRDARMSAHAKRGVVKRMHYIVMHRFVSILYQEFGEKYM